MARGGPVLRSLASQLDHTLFATVARYACAGPVGWGVGPVPPHNAATSEQPMWRVGRLLVLRPQKSFICLSNHIDALAMMRLIGRFNAPRLHGSGTPNAVC